jgi:hypothetical protein
MNFSKTMKWFMGYGFICAIMLVLLTGPVFANEPQIPNIFLNNLTKLEGRATVFIDARQGLTSGTFTISIAASCAPPDYPSGQVEMQINMNDSSIVYFRNTTVEALSSTGKYTPTAYIMGRCDVESVNEAYRGCHYWITLADNGYLDENKTPDIVGFLVLDGNGKRIAYGTGPVVRGDIYVSPTGN